MYIRVPGKSGSVYTIAPRDDPTQVRQVHCSLLKAVVVVGSHNGAVAPSPPAPEHFQSEDEWSCNGDWLVVRPENPLSTPCQVEAVTQITPKVLVPPLEPAPPVPSPQVAPAVADATSLPVAGHTVRRTARLTAGHHSNVYHLPRSAGGAGQGESLCFILQHSCCIIQAVEMSMVAFGDFIVRTTIQLMGVDCSSIVGYHGNHQLCWSLHQSMWETAI